MTTVNILKENEDWTFLLKKNWNFNGNNYVNHCSVNWALPTVEWIVLWEWRWYELWTIVWQKKVWEWESADTTNTYEVADDTSYRLKIPFTVLESHKYKIQLQ